MGHKKVDLVVIGSGPAGQKAAIQAVKLGKQVALVEKRRVVGGVCTHTGTIPSKTLREAIMYLSGYRQRSLYGRGYAVKKNVTYQDLILHVNHVVAHEIEVTNDQLTRTGVEIVQGVASFQDSNTVSVETDQGIVTLETDKVIIATGTTPYRSPRVPFNNINILDTDTIFSKHFKMERLPKSMLIIGAGVIGTEYACMFSALGVDVRLLDRRTEMFRFVDPEILEALVYHMRNERVTLYLGKDFESVEVDEDMQVKTVLENGRAVKTEMLLFSSGRTGATEGLRLDLAGVEVGNRGLIEVNEQFQTSAENIYAVGDIVGFPALASTSMEQGRCAACYAFGVPVTTFHHYPYGIYTIPEISMVGKTERELSEMGVPYEIGLGRYREIAKGKIIGDSTGLLKLIFDQRDAKLLGVHIIGEGATELIHIGQAVLAFGGSIDYFVETVFNYPTLAEAYKLAALNGLKRLGWTPGNRRDLEIAVEHSE
ncbi:MAG: Si-specific NAD(P)(+) transhydrogenase [Candidatus Omnitrophica bacterium]|nr:Si-specific NAD(P)(+) transhydrogenase [Candidatus Omnitrophota bacterium]MCB9767780.1 Si-specific NAD(P)(+) transhydrogenase [Candidatus Omnitrophota bacterium]MCB9781981.1 Si-specific NAD(P)(+) transhydrogenase [Candidatus Omnitrophota bacterium]